MRRGQVSVAKFHGVSLELSALHPEGDEPDRVYFEEDSNGRRFIEGAWGQRVGLAKPAPETRPATGSPNHFSDFFDCVGRLWYVQSASDGTVHAVEMPEGAW